MNGSDKMCLPFSMLRSVVVASLASINNPTTGITHSLCINSVWLSSYNTTMHASATHIKPLELNSLICSKGEITALICILA